jgi:hypothetical protein
MLYAALVELIGDVPVGFEPLVYIAAFLVLVYLLSTTFSILWAILNWIAGGMRP